MSNYYYEPVNLNRWNMFDKVKSLGHKEFFLATKDMRKGDFLLLNVGKQDKSIETGVYAIAEIISDPYLLENHPDDYCNGKLSVDTKIIWMEYNSPIIDHDNCRLIFSQFRSAHKLELDKKALLENILGKAKHSKNKYGITNPKSKILKVGATDMVFHTIKEAVNYCFDANLDYNIMQGTFPLKKDIWKYYMAWFPKFAYKDGQKFKTGSGTLDSNWYNYISDDGTKIIEYNEGVQKEKYEIEKDFYRLVFGKMKKEEYKFVGVFRMVIPYKDDVNYAYREYELVSDTFDPSTIMNKPVFDVDIESIKKVYKIAELSETEKNILAKARMGQSLFRENLINKYDCSCMLCGLKNKELLVASHIKEWCNSNNKERLDVNNGLLLCTQHDALFDNHLISFDEEGKVMISKDLNTMDRRLCNISEKSCIKSSTEMENYMKFHRNNFFEKQRNNRD
ncbi:MAG: HNH endonuclease [Erysipelotrichaceae bacterium]